jgi:selenocysteine lyase/cysteine desulfurase
MSNYNLKQDFKIFENNPGLVYLDSTATTQKPEYVTSGIKEYLENDY